MLSFSAAGAQTPKTKAIAELQRQLQENHAQLKALASRHLIPPQPTMQADTPDPASPTPLTGKHHPIPPPPTIQTDKPDLASPTPLTGRSHWHAK